MTIPYSVRNFWNDPHLLEVVGHWLPNFSVTGVILCDYLSTYCTNVCTLRIVQYLPQIERNNLGLSPNFSVTVRKNFHSFAWYFLMLSKLVRKLCGLEQWWLGLHFVFMQRSESWESCFGGSRNTWAVRSVGIGGLTVMTGWVAQARVRCVTQLLQIAAQTTLTSCYQLHI